MEIDDELFIYLFLLKNPFTNLLRNVAITTKRFPIDSYHWVQSAVLIIIRNAAKIFRQPFSPRDNCHDTRRTLPRVPVRSNKDTSWPVDVEIVGWYFSKIRTSIGGQLICLNIELDNIKLGTKHRWQFKTNKSKLTGLVVFVQLYTACLIWLFIFKLLSSWFWVCSSNFFHLFSVQLHK